MKRVAAIALVAVFALAGCSANDGVAGAYGDGTNKGYVTGDGYTSYDVGSRLDAGTWTSVTDTGEPISSDDFTGEVLVLNFWYAACAPCRTEAPLLESLSAKYAGDGVQFVGVNVRDQAENSLNFSKEFGVNYPSVIDTDDGNVQFAFASSIPANATPTTLVIDKQGRVAARISGELDGTSLLDTFISDALAEDS
jgi:thiol-disulfide isomerase/thioredoxin